MKTKKMIIASLIAMTLFASCDSTEKNGETPEAVTTEEITADATIDSSIDDVTNIIEDQYTNKQSITSKSEIKFKSILPTCATVTWILKEGLFTGTIDFGNEGCALENGNVLKGKITITFSSNLTAAEQTITYSFDGFMHNGKKLQGTKTVVRSLKSTELLATIHPVLSCTMDLIVTFGDGKTYTRTGNRIREMVEGFDTIGNWEDNVFLVTGSNTTTMANGTKCTNTIKTPLRFVTACKKPFPVSGTILKVKNEKETLVDFGNGECDNLATVTITGVTTTIELKK